MCSDIGFNFMPGVKHFINVFDNVLNVLKSYDTNGSNKIQYPLFGIYKKFYKT